MPDRFTKKWVLESHPTNEPIPLAVWAMYDSGARKLVFACEKDLSLHDGYKKIVATHNSAVTAKVAM